MADETMLPAFRLDFRDQGDGQAWMHCPICDIENVHIERVEVDAGGEVIEINHEGPGFARRPSTPDQVRGSVTRLEFWCEDGHRFALRLEFRKGAMI